ncbi:hypothetical protein Val02_09540 [Virgisporangium aliadipatigenens]|uniref:PNPLA domain-containing protein n=1 Tax=Virgisporangium aliadipatigenens TaxID=741659 RepID=A0A8J4DNY6_9ACTN|nr:hypothetical protein [Virgisporangium aliadipatigenens]GIJ44068.1 hypothetical protein Val02_09540 [Virgisporangium aliadipatigenens]
MSRRWPFRSAPPIVDTTAEWATPVGQPAGGPLSAPTPATGTDAKPVPRPEGIGICCSGGGIRSAAFNLGALQALSAAGLYRQARFVSAVSGGSYMAAGFATVHHGPAAPGERGVERPREPDYAFSPGSAEERHLRNRSNYLFPRLATTVRGLVWVLFGLFANLSALLVFVFLAARVIGWLADGNHVLREPDGDVRLDLPPQWRLAAAVPFAVGVFVLLVEKVIPAYGQPRQRIVDFLRTSGTSLMAVGAVVALLLLALPAATVGLQKLALGNLPDPTTARVVTALGFATPEDCRQAADAFEKTGACGVLPKEPEDAAAEATEAARNARPATTWDLTGLLGFATALVMVIRRLIRQAGGLAAGLRPRTAEGAPPGPLRQAFYSVERRVLAWTGSGLVVLFVLLLAARWMSDAASAGAGRAELLKCAYALLLFAALKTFTDINRNSLHPYYREQLASAYLVRRERRDGRTVAKPVPYERPLSLSQVRRKGPDDGPELIVCAAANITDQSVPPGRGCVPFTFTPTDIGLAEPPNLLDRLGRSRAGRLSVRRYERAAGARRVTLPAAVAVSGAAVSPLAGRMTRPSQRLLLAVANIRLGLWLPNPMYRSRPGPQPHRPRGPRGRWHRLVARRHPTTAGMRALIVRWRRAEVLRRERIARRRAAAARWHRTVYKGRCRLARRYPRSAKWLRGLVEQWRQPGPWRLLMEAAGHTNLRSRWLYVTDGGHYDNLGLVEALRRRPETILAFDGSGDPVDRWSTIGGALALARSELGVHVEIDPASMKPVDRQFVERPYVRGKVWYPPVDRDRDADATLWVTKLGVTERSPWDVRAYARRFPDFPCDATVHQLYGGEQLEAYRALGHDSTTQMLEAMTDEPAPAAATGPPRRGSRRRPWVPGRPVPTGKPGGPEQPTPSSRGKRT